MANTDNNKAIREVVKFQLALQESKKDEQKIKDRHEKELHDFRQRKFRMLSSYGYNDNIVILRLRNAASVIYSVFRKKTAEYKEAERALEVMDLHWVNGANAGNIVSVKVSGNMLSINTSLYNGGTRLHVIPLDILTMSDWAIGSYARKKMRAFKLEQAYEKMEEILANIKSANEQLVAQQLKLKTLEDDLLSSQKTVAKRRNDSTPAQQESEYPLND